jgi:hypothetical protein
MSGLILAVLLEVAIGMACAAQEAKIVGWTIVERGETPVEVQFENVHSGKAGLRIYSRAGLGAAGIVRQDLKLSEISGQRVRPSWFSLHKDSTAVVRYQIASSDGAIGRGESRASGNLCRTKAMTTCDWTENVFVLDIPQRAIGLTIELTAENSGWVCFDDFAISIVDANYIEPCHAIDGDCGSVKVPGVSASKPSPAGRDDAIIQRYLAAPTKLVNPGFEAGTPQR